LYLDMLGTYNRSLFKLTVISTPFICISELTLLTMQS